MATFRRVRQFLAHTRFVPTRVYRLMVLAWLISGVLQLLYGAPISVQDSSGEQNWFDWAFVGAQLLSALFILVGLYLVEEHVDPFVDEAEAARYSDRLNLSLTIELMGVIGIMTVIVVQTAATTFYYGRVPAAGTSWMAILFAVFLGFRVRDIVKAQRKLAR